MMDNENLRLLLCTNGAETTKPALEYGEWLADLLHFPTLILGIVEREEAQDQVEALLEETIDRFDKHGLAYQSRLEYGETLQIIDQLTQDSKFLTVIGPFGRPIWRRMVRGRTFRRLLALVETPIVYVPQVCLPLKHILLCMGGLEFSQGIGHLSIYLARLAQADVTLLHVVEPITLDYPTTRQVHDHGSDILHSETPQAHNLNEALGEMKAAGLTTKFKVRHGNPVHEILEEVESGEYQMIGLGSAYSAHSLRHLYLPNVTAEVAEAADLPVLAVRQKHELVN